MASPASIVSLTGVLERIIFFNEENHYTIAELRPDRGDGTVTITGPLPDKAKRVSYILPLVLPIVL